MLPEEERAGAAQEDELRIALTRGDLATAEQLARVAYDGVRGSVAVSDHGHAARVPVAIQEEAGHGLDASKIADEYLTGRDAWEPGPVFEDWEADLGRTFVLGDDPRKHRIAADVARAWEAGAAYFRGRPDITAAQLYCTASAGT